MSTDQPSPPLTAAARRLRRQQQLDDNNLSRLTYEAPPSPPSPEPPITYGAGTDLVLNSSLHTNPTATDHIGNSNPQSAATLADHILNPRHDSVSVPDDQILHPDTKTIATASSSASLTERRLKSSPSWRRRPIAPAPPVAARPLDPTVAGMLKTILCLCRELGGGAMKQPKVCQRRNSAAICRRAATLGALFEELRDSDTAWIPPTALRSFVHLREILGRAKALIHHCRHSSNLVLLLLEQEAVEEQFRQISLNLAELLAPLPYDLLQISPDVQDQVRLVERQSAIAAVRSISESEDRREAALRREIEATMAALEDGREAPVESQLIRIFDGLGFVEAADCVKELKKMEAEKERLRQQQCFDKVLEINNLMSFVRWARCILYGLNAASDAAATAACRRIDLSVSRKTVVLAGGAAIPEDFRCPISLEIMVDPMVAASGHSYERAAIERWLADGHYTCPKTGAKLLHRHLTPNIALRRLIAQWCAENDYVLEDDAGAAAERHLVDALPASAAAREATRLTAAFLKERLFSGGAAVHRQAAHELRLMAKEGMANRESMAASGVIPALVSLLQSGVDAETEEHAVTALLNLSISDKNKETIMSTPGSVATIVGVLVSGRNDAARENAAAALFSLTAVRDHRVRVGAEEGAIDGLLAVLRGGGGERGRRDATATLFNIALHREHAAEMRRKGAVRVVIEAVKEGEEDAVSLLAVLLRKRGEEEGGGAEEVGEVTAQLVAVAAGGGGGNPRAQEHALSLLVAGCNYRGEAREAQEKAVELRRRLVADSSLVVTLRRVKVTGTPRAQRKASSLLKLLQNHRTFEYQSRFSNTHEMMGNNSNSNYFTAVNGRNIYHDESYRTEMSRSLLPH